MSSIYEKSKYNLHFFLSISVNRERIYSDSFTKENQKKFRVLDWLRDWSNDGVVDIHYVNLVLLEWGLIELKFVLCYCRCRLK